jgi:hypothetical protein
MALADPMARILDLAQAGLDDPGLIAAAATVPDEVVDRPIEMSVEGIDDDATLRTLLNAMVTQEEHWISALRGGD